MDTYKIWYKDREKKIFEDFFHFLQFPSVSSEPTYKKDLTHCVHWLKKFLDTCGLETELWETSGHPVLFGSCMADPQFPTLLFYMHYDVQPPDPLELWENPPFSPEIRNGKVYARGASDNKGQCFYTLCAIKAFLEEKRPRKINIKVCIEGEEEMGSHGLIGILPEKKQKLKADYVYIVDLGIPSLDKPRVTLGTRGILTMDLHCKSAAFDLHSGGFGGIAINPIRVLVDVLSKLWDNKGKITVPHMYDDVKELSKEFLSQLDLEFDEEQIKSEFGLIAIQHEEGFKQPISNWLRPSLEINGISGGYAGKGFKTIIPAKANAKLSCRMVANQDPEKIGKSIAGFLKAHLMKGAKVEIDIHSGSRAVLCDPQSSIAKIVSKAYEVVFGQPCKGILSGGTIPVAEPLSNASKGEMIMIGTCLPTDCFHAPNEHFAVKCFEMGFCLITTILEKMEKV